ncbi:hypothetical protein [Janthinobacterium tructae]
MSVSIKIAQWVQKKPMILIRFDEVFSESLHNSRQGVEHLTIVKLIIDAIAKGDKSVVLTWQRKVQESNP